MLSRDIFHYHHRRKFSKEIHEELLQIAWHLDRVYDWCFDEEEKGFLEDGRDVEILILSRNKLKKEN